MFRKAMIIAVILIYAFVLNVPARAAAPHNNPFFAVDIDGSSDDGNVGPLQTAPPDGFPDWPVWYGWTFVNTPPFGVNTFSGTFDAISVTITTKNKDFVDVGSRDREEPPEANNGYLNNLYRDFFFLQHNSTAAWGEEYIKINFGGFEPNKPYEITIFSWDAFYVPTNPDTQGKYSAWGVANPSNYPSYQPTAGGGGLAPKRVRINTGGYDPCDPCLADPFAYAGSFTVKTDGDGNAIIYGWADNESWSGSSHLPINGFAIGKDPNANNPQPTNGESNIQLGLATLSWEPGFWAKDTNAHHVYLGTDYNAVNDANTNTAGIYLGNPTDTFCTVPTTLASGKIYYWRVDEVNDACDPGYWKGQVWHFSTVTLITKKSTVKAGKTQANDAVLLQEATDINHIKDSITLSGTVYLPTDRENIDRIDINFVSGDGNVIYSQQIDFNEYNNVTIKRGKYSYSHKITKTDPQGAITSLKIDFSKTPNTFAVTATNINLTGLACPVQLEILMGDSSFLGDANEAIVNGKKLIPTRLMRMYKNTLIVTSAKASHSTKPLSDSLSVKGEIAPKSISNLNMNDPNLVLRDVNFIWGDQTFTVPDHNFVAAKTGHKYTCKKSVSKADTGLVSATIDLDNCTFTVSVSGAENLQVLPTYPTVDFNINYGIGDEDDFCETATVNLTTRRSY